MKMRIKNNYAYILAVLLCLALTSAGKAAYAQQKNALSSKLWEGIAVVGYADEGMYVNCGGPSVKFGGAEYAVSAGLLPTIRIKRDAATAPASRNSRIMPTLGFGLTGILMKHLVVQVPAFYQAKTVTENGYWTIGMGIGYKF